MIEYLIEKIIENKILEIKILDKNFECYSENKFNQILNEKMDFYKSQILDNYRNDQTQINGELKIEDFKACYLKRAGYRGQDSKIAEGDVYLNYQILFIRDPDTPDRDIIDIHTTIFIKNNITRKLNYPKKILYYFKEKN